LNGLRLKSCYGPLLVENHAARKAATVIGTMKAKMFLAFCVCLICISYSEVIHRDTYRRQSNLNYEDGNDIAQNEHKAILTVRVHFGLRLGPENALEPIVKIACKEWSELAVLEII
jgi:hypothetical protein